MEAIASARAQFGVSKHVWIADQGSDPENLAILKPAVEGAPDATLVRLDRNWGVAGGRNRATALGAGRVLFALDNDAEFAAPDTLARAVRALDAEPDLAAIACRILVHATGAEDLSSWGYPPSLLPRAAESFDTTTFVGAGHAIRRADFEEAGGYDDALFIAGASWTARGARCSPPFLPSNPSPPLHADPRRTPTKAGRRSPGLRRARSGARPASGFSAPAMERIATLPSVLPFHAASSAVACARPSPSGRRQKPRRTARRRRA